MKDIQEKLKEIGPFVPAADDDMLICRCEEVTKGEIRKAVHSGMFTMEEIRRFLTEKKPKNNDTGKETNTYIGAIAEFFIHLFLNHLGSKKEVSKKY